MKDREIVREFLKKEYKLLTFLKDRAIWAKKGYWYEVDLGRRTIQQTKPERDKVHAYSEVGKEYIQDLVD